MKGSLAQHLTHDENYENHASRAFDLYKQKKYLQSALSYDSLLLQNDGNTADKYNAACSWALANNSEKAFYYLDKVVNQNNYSNLSHITSDSDLNSLHTDKRWENIIAVVTKNREEKDKKLNKPITAALDTILKDDQDIRKNISVIEKQYGWQSKQMDSLLNRMRYCDSINLGKVKSIIDKYGWLGPEEVGDIGAMTIFLVIQHADSLTQVTYLPLMREAVQKEKALPQNLALLEDRVLMKQNKKQIYGSQTQRNDTTGKYEFWPIEDEANVNKRRASVGLEPIEKYAKRLGVDYKPPKNK